MPIHIAGIAFSPLRSHESAVVPLSRKIFDNFSAACLNEEARESQVFRLGGNLSQ